MPKTTRIRRCTRGIDANDAIYVLLAINDTNGMCDADGNSQMQYCRYQICKAMQLT